MGASLVTVPSLCFLTVCWPAAAFAAGLGVNRVVIWSVQLPLVFVCQKIVRRTAEAVTVFAE